MMSHVFVLFTDLYNQWLRFVHSITKKQGTRVMAITRVGETLQLWGMQEAASCPCGHPTQTVEHVVTDCVLLKSPGDLTALCCPNAETRSWLSELPIEL